MSTLKVTNIQATGETASRAVSGVAAAWAWVDQKTDNAIDQSNNASSFTDEGTGAGRVSVSNAFANSQPVTNVTTYRSTIGIGTGNSGASTYNTSDLRIVTKNDAGSATDTEFGIVAHGDLA